MGRKPSKKAKGLYFEKLEQDLQQANKKKEIQTLKDDDLFEVDTVGNIHSNRNQKRLDDLAKLLLDDNRDPTFKPKPKQPKPFTVAKPVVTKKSHAKIPHKPKPAPIETMKVVKPLIDLDGDEDIVVHPKTGELVNKWTGRPVPQLTKRLSIFQQKDQDEDDDEDNEDLEQSSDTQQQQQHPHTSNKKTITADKPSPASNIPVTVLRHALVTGKLTNTVSDNNEFTEYDVWDDIPPAVAAKAGKKRHVHKLLEATREYFHDDVKRLVKARRHRSANKVVIKRTKVAPPGLSINPQPIDVEALTKLVLRRRALTSKKIAYIRRRLCGDIPIPRGKEAFRRTKFAMHKKLQPIVVGPTQNKLKTRTQRNKERRKNIAKYEYAIAQRELKRLKQYDDIPKILDKIERHEDYLKNKLPQLKKEREEFKRSQPKLLSRNFYVAPMPKDIPDEKTIKKSKGQLRRVNPSRHLLSDFFTDFQSRNMIQTAGRRGPKSRRSLATHRMRDVRLASHAYTQEIDVDSIVQRAEERARSNPKQFAPTKNAKRRLIEETGVDPTRVVKRSRSSNSSSQTTTKTSVKKTKSGDIKRKVISKQLIDDDDDEFVPISSLSKEAFADSDIWTF